MIENRLHEQLQRTGGRIRRQRLAAAVALVWSLMALLAAGLWLAGRFAGPLPAWTVPALAIVGLLATLVVMAACAASADRPRRYGPPHRGFVS